MSIEESVLASLKGLPVHKQLEVLDFAEFLAQKQGTNGPRKSPLGLWADLGVDITAKDIDEARKEMWGQFPREDI